MYLITSLLMVIIYALGREEGGRQEATSLWLEAELGRKAEVRAFANSDITDATAGKVVSIK